MRSSAAALLGCLALALGGCNAVISDRPFFTSEPSAPELRNGLWRAVEANCRFDERKPVERWPDCAGWAVVREGETLSFAAADVEKRATRRWVATPFVVGGGDPLILQQSCAEGDGADLRYCYSGMNILARDAGGRATHVEVWSVSCGPLASGDRVTRTPWPGLTIRGDNCLPDSAATIREAATRSLELNGKDTPLTQLYWVRDGYR